MVKPFIIFISAIISYILIFFSQVGYLLDNCYLKKRKKLNIFPKSGKFILIYYPKSGIIIYR
jgi:hypothetical protein